MMSRIKMTIVFLMMMTFLTLVKNNVVDAAKTTAMVAVAAGKCAPPAAAEIHVVMTMGSVRVAIDHSVIKVMNKASANAYPDTAPDWVQDLATDLGRTLKDNIDSGLAVVRADLVQEIQNSEDRTNEKIDSLRNTVETVKDSNKILNKKFEDLNLKALQKRIEDISAEMADLKARGRTNKTDDEDPNDEDKECYDRNYELMKNSIGLAPFTGEDFTRVKEHLMSENVINEDTPKEDVQKDVFSLSLMDFWRNDMGLSEDLIDQLDRDCLRIWAKQVPFREAAPGTYTLYACYKNIQGRLLMFKAAKMMNRMCRKKQIEFRKLLLWVIPQLEARFTVLNRLSYDIREEIEREEGVVAHTRIDFEDNTIVLQVKRPSDNYHRTVDVERKYPEIKIPGIQYKVKEYAEKQPKAYAFQGLKTPPGRSRSNIPLRNPEQNPTREERSRLSRRPSFVSEPSNSNMVPLGRSDSGLDRRQQLARDREKSTSAAADSLGQNLINLDGIYSNPVASGSTSSGPRIISPPSSSGSSSVDTSTDSSQVTVIEASNKNPFTEIDPLSSAFKGNPKNSAGYSFEVKRNFGTKRKTPPRSQTSPTDSVKTVKRGRPTTKNNGVGTKTTRTTKTAKPQTQPPEKSVKTSILKNIILGNRSKHAGEKDKDSAEESDVVTADLGNDTFDLDI